MACPDYIKGACRRPVEIALSQVLTLQKRVTAINEALTGVIGDTAAEVAAVVALLPLPPGWPIPLLSLADIIDLLTCPLTPAALALEPALLTNMDPSEIYTRVQDVMGRYAQQVNRSYEEGLDALDPQALSPLRRFYRDLRRINLDAVTFAEAVALTVYVKAVDPTEFSEGPYEEFEETITGFSVTGFVPSGLSADVDGAMVELLGGQAVVTGWRVLATAPPPFRVPAIAPPPF